jgi:hypothetical protein
MLNSRFHSGMKNNIEGNQVNGIYGRTAVSRAQDHSVI